MKKKIYFLISILLVLCQLLATVSLADTVEDKNSDDSVLDSGTEYLPGGEFLIEEEPVEGVLGDIYDGLAEDSEASAELESPESSAKFDNSEALADSDNQSVNSLLLQSLKARRADNLPASYGTDLINKGLPSVRNQNYEALCWAFAGIAGVEINAIKKGLSTASTTDYSERHLAYFSLNRQDDKLGGITGDYATSSSSYMNTLANVSIAAHTLVNWKGAVDETVAPYNDEASMRTGTDIAFDKDVIHVTDMRCYNMSTDAALIKRDIMEKGSAQISYYSADKYLNKSNGAYYCPSDITTNHAVTVIGWDDNYSRYNFNSLPVSDGAWIVRNSYGDSFGDKGYIYISYEDKSIGPNAYVFEVEKPDNKTNIYQYDGAVLDTSKILGTDSIMIANVFKAHANSSGRERISAVGFYTNMANLDYEIWLYTGGIESMPDKGVKLLKTSIVGKTEATGYYTIPINENVYVNENHSFAVVIKFTKNGRTISVPIEGNRKVGTISSVASAGSRESFVYQNGVWEDFGSYYNANLRIKAYTDNVAADYQDSVSDDNEDTDSTAEKTKRTRIKRFVSRLYNIYLDRQPESEGLEYWTEELMSKRRNSAQVVCGIIGSEEFNNKQLNAEEKVERMYEAMLGREPDTDGLRYWKAKLEKGMSLFSIVKGFVGSDEFAAICRSYDILPGDVELDQMRDMNEGITGYVSRCYTKILARAYDIDGLNDWCGRILKAKDKRSEAKTTVANGFIHSQEFINRNTTNREYVKILYETFLDREYDEEGMKYWLDKLSKGTSRDEVLRGFADSVEFSNILDSYGLN